MLILFLSVLLALLGILLVVISFSSLEKKTLSVYRDNEELLFDDTPGDAETSTKEINAESSPAASLSATPEDNVISNVSIYEDRDSVISPGTEKAIEYSEIGKYKSLRRLASGDLVLSSASLTLRDSKKLFRYDLHKIKNIISLEKSALIYIDSLTYPLLFVCDDSGFAAKIEYLLKK
ncbi:MAG TPA: hypothetical protein PK624_00405 [Spirochaetota bacterium]|nr:hypothetical protein [Spirochaetota bacterium]HOR43240.1 hypothetical protein [Spirochaetota bacterium]HPK55010.1 hypothetical protein [Spirochaetota bacterium]